MVSRLLRFRATKPHMNPTTIPAAADAAARKRSIAFLNWAHALDHFVLLIYPTVVIGLVVVYQRPYSELIALSTAAFVTFGVFALPAGWLADRWSRRNMMGAFYIGCGVSLAGAAFAPNLPTLAAALFMLGMFASIYHPVGMAMLIEASNARGRTLAFNGVCGNLGVSLAAGISAGLATWVGWRAAFLVPAAVSVVTGIVYLWLTPDDRHHAKSRKSVAAVPLTGRRAVILFGLFIVIALTAGTTFNLLTIALPKIVDERLAKNVPLLLAGSIATLVLVCGGLAQLSIGRLVERFSAHSLFAAVTGLGFLGNLWAANADGIPLMFALAVCRCRDLRAGHGQRYRAGALYRRRLARPRLLGALFPAVHQRRRCDRHDLAAARPRRLCPCARGQCGHRAGDVCGHRCAGFGRFQVRSAARRGATGAGGIIFKKAAGSGPRSSHACASSPARRCGCDGIPSDRARNRAAPRARPI